MNNNQQTETLTASFIWETVAQVFEVAMAELYAQDSELLPAAEMVLHRIKTMAKPRQKAAAAVMLVGIDGLWKEQGRAEWQPNYIDGRFAGGDLIRHGRTRHIFKPGPSSKRIAGGVYNCFLNRGGAFGEDTLEAMKILAEQDLHLQQYDTIKPEFWPEYLAYRR